MPDQRENHREGISGRGLEGDMEDRSIVDDGVDLGEGVDGCEGGLVKGRIEISGGETPWWLYLFTVFRGPFGYSKSRRAICSLSWACGLYERLGVR